MISRSIRMFCQLAANTTPKSAIAPATNQTKSAHGAIPFFSKSARAHELHPHPHIDTDHELSQMESHHEENHYNNFHHLG